MKWKHNKENRTILNIKTRLEKYISKYSSNM